MIFLTVGYIIVPVAPNGVQRTVEEIGEKARSFDGTMLQEIRGRKSRWAIKTAPMIRSKADSLEAALTGTPPVQCQGECFGGTVQCFPEFNGWDMITVRGGHAVVMQFVLHEA